MNAAPELPMLLAQSAMLPTLPQVVSQVLTVLNDESADADLLVQRLNTDQVIAARLLAAANSAAFGLTTRIESVRQAILVLGLGKVRTITLATAIIDTYSHSPAGFDLRQLWRHSIGVAVCARVLAEGAGYAPEVAFTAGLLHDIGQLLMVTAAPGAYAEVLRRRQTFDENVVDAEQAVFGYDHADVGGGLVRLWQLPADVADAIQGHHGPDKADHSEMADLVHIAEALSHALDLGETPNNRVPALSDRACAGLCIDWNAYAARFAEIGARYDGMRLALGL